MDTIVRQEQVIYWPDFVTIVSGDSISFNKFSLKKWLSGSRRSHKLGPLHALIQKQRRQSAELTARSSKYQDSEVAHCSTCASAVNR
jgi:hypothetical protein